MLGHAEPGLDESRFFPKFHKEGELRVGLFAYNWEADTSLALWNLISFAQKEPVIAERVLFKQHCAPTPKSTNAEENELFAVLKWIDGNHFDVIGFSCYIWNIKFINRIAQAVKELWPHIRVIYGGQQIRGYYVPQVFERERCVDICVVNEGEITFQQLLLSLLNGAPLLSEIGGLAYWSRNVDRNTPLQFSGGGGLIPAECSFHHTGAAQLVDDLNLIPSPYLGSMELPLGGAYLYEASRGCPYQCSFCIWGESKGVREYSMDRVEAEVRSILEKKPSHIMFCDGTFNMRKERAVHILGILVEYLRDGKVEPFSLLLELKLEIIDDNLARVMDKLIHLNPLVTVEFGLQSSSQEAAVLMRRPFKEERFLSAWNRLSAKLKSSAIIDCIYGLPGDGVEQFKATVDFCYSLSPHRIQCFRLSILPGSEFERQALEFNLRFSREPTHMVYETKWLNLDQMAWIETFGFAVADLYHFHTNSIKCILSLPAAQTIRFSELITRFVKWLGREGIIDSSYGGNRPEGRWRAIDLTKAYTHYLFGVVLPEFGITDEDTVRRFEDLLQYEATLGKIAVEGLAVQPIQLLLSNLEAPIAVRAEVMYARYDIPTFIVNNRGKVKVDMSELAKNQSIIAFTEKAGHQETHTPISYKISERAAALIQRLIDGSVLDQAECPVDIKAVQKLREAGLVVQAANNN